MIRKLTYLLLVVAMCCCSKENSLERISTLLIEPYTVQNGTIPESEFLVECMLAKEESTGNVYYLYLGRIVDFDFEEGYKYRLKVIITTVENPPMDGYKEEFKLQEILSKQKVNKNESENIH